MLASGSPQNTGQVAFDSGASGQDRSPAGTFALLEQQCPVESARGLSALVVDDEPLNREFAALVLEPLAPRLSFAADGREAVEACRRTAFDIVLMDMNMPVMSGNLAIEQIRDIEAGTGRHRSAIVMFSANQGLKFVDAALASGADAYVDKTATIDGLLAAVILALERSGAPRDVARRSAA